MTLETTKTFEPKAGQFYDGLDNQAYHDGPGISSSELKIIPDWSPLHFHKRKPKKQTPAMVLGNVLHALVLEPETVADRYLFAPGLKLNTKAGKERMADIERLAQDTNRQVIREDVDALQRIADAIHKHPAWQLITGAEPAFERSFYWEDSETGELLKCRPDALNLTYGSKGYALITDLKSAQDPRDRAFQKQVVDLGYSFSASMYCAGVEAVTGQKCGWAWFVFEKTAPYATRVVFAGEKWLAHGRRLYREALATLAECRKTNTWPGLDGGHAVVLDFPKWLEREEAEATR